MKIGVLKDFYFDFLTFLKKKGFFKENNILIYSYENFGELEIALKANLVDIILSSNSLIEEEKDVYDEIIFIKNAYKIFGTQFFLEKLRKEDEIIKVGIPQKNTKFKKYFYSFYKNFYGKSEKIQWLELADYELGILFENNYIDFAIVFEPITFKIITNRCASLVSHKNKYEIPFSFIYKRENFYNSIGEQKILNFNLAISNIRKSIIEENLLEQFLSEKNSKYYYLKTYISIFIQSFYIDEKINSKQINKFNIDNKDFSNNEAINIKNETYINIYQAKDEKFIIDHELIFMIKNEINKLIQYGINQTPYCDIGTLSELKILKILIENFKNREKIYKLKTLALKNKNFILSEDLENRQQTLSDLFMQFRATSENLMIKNIQVEESIKEKDRLIAIISHDLKTPLSGILSMTQQLLEDEKDESKRRKLSIMLESGNTLFLLINNLLENAKDVSTSKRLDEKIFDFNKLVYSVVSNIKEKIKEKGIELKLDYDDSIPKILIGDSLKLNQILYNLLGNSAKFTNKGYIELKLKLLEKDISSCKLMIQVSDTGIGISENKLEHIFDPFVQEDETIKEKYGGTGLGLSIVKDYVELMGGKIDAKSEKNKGTSFTIILTFSLPKEKENAKDITKIQKYIVFNDAKILILEDNLINQEVIKGYLSDYKSLNLVFKQNGKEGLEEIEKDKYDLILSDIMMPEMDGKEFCINFRKIDKVTPLIALTAFNSKEDIDELKRIGFNSFISKPYTREELVGGISNYISVKEIIPEEKNLYELAEKSKNSEKIDRFKKLFLEDLKNRYDELKAGIENKDKDKIRFFSHNLKGIAPTLGFPQFAELAEKASLLYKEDRWDELVKIKEEFLEMVDKIYNDL